MSSIDHLESRKKALMHYFQETVRAMKNNHNSRVIENITKSFLVICMGPKPGNDEDTQTAVELYADLISKVARLNDEHLLSFKNALKSISILADSQIGYCYPSSYEDQSFFRKLLLTKNEAKMFSVRNRDFQQIVRMAYDLAKIVSQSLHHLEEI